LFNAARRSKPFLVASFILLIFPSLTRSIAQERFISTTQDGALSDAQDTTQSGANDSRLTGTGSLSGTVLDTNQDVLQGARVTLAGQAAAAIQTVESGSNGQFAFTGLPPDVYKLTVTAAGMNTFTSAQIPVHAGEARIVPAVTEIGKPLVRPVRLEEV
jgi:Carboxypeptidase regulatory-like domain